MTIIKFLKKLFQEIINFIKAISLAILGFFLKPTKEQKKKQDEQQKVNQNKNATQLPNTENILPDDINSKSSNHEDQDTTNSVILELPKTKIKDLTEIDSSSIEIIFTDEYICQLIEEELNRIYKDRNLKVEKLDERIEAEKEIKKTIKKFEEKVVPKIKKEIAFYHLKQDEEVKKTVHKVVEVEIKEFPILPPLEVEVKKVPEAPTPSPTLDNTSTITLPKTKSQSSETLNETPHPEEIYSIAYQEDRSLNLPETPPKVSASPIISVDNTLKIEEKLASQKTTMIQNTDTIPKPSITDTIKNTAAVATLIVAKTTEELLTPEKDPTPPAKDTELTQIERQLENEPTRLEEVEDLKKELEKKLDEIKKEEPKIEPVVKPELALLEDEQEKKRIAEELKRQQEERLKKEKEALKQREEQAKSLIRDTEISAITINTDSAIEESNEELEKEDFFDKDYDRIEYQIDRMLEDITNTRLRYGNKLTSKQRSKLDREERKLRDAKEHIANEKSKDIEYEQSQLTDYITPEELMGLQNEIKLIDEQNKEEINAEFLKRMSKLEGMTQDQVANADKRILFKRLNKASLLLEMGSILAFPFIRNRYFLYFTLGLIIDNHFNFINAFWRRKVNKYEPADLSQIKQGQDALNGALDITFQNLIQLDQIEQDALARYPELANDPRFVTQVTNLRIKLNNNYNKLMRKNKIMETYYGKTKRQTKILKKELKPEQNES